MCVCVFTHIHPHTPPPAAQVEKTQRTLLSPMSPAVKNDPPCPTASAIHRPAEIPHYRLPTPTEQSVPTWALMSKHLCQNTSVKYMPAHASVLKNTCLMHGTLSAKNARAPVHAHLCDGAETSLPWKLLRTILSLVEALWRLLPVFAARPATVSTKSVPRRCSLKKTIQIHASSWRGRRCGVAQASFNHLRWWRPHSNGLYFALACYREAHSRQKSVSAHASLQTLWLWTYQWDVLKLGWQQPGTVSWVLRDSWGAHHPLSPVITLGIRQPRKKESDHVV